MRGVTLRTLISKESMNVFVQFIFINVSALLAEKENRC